MLPQPMTPTPSAFAISSPLVGPRLARVSKILRRLDRAAGKALEVGRVVVLHDEVAGAGAVAQRLQEPWPVDGAMADIRPAVLLPRFPVQRDVLHMGRDDAIALLFDPVDCAGAGASDP